MTSELASPASVPSPAAEDAVFDPDSWYAEEIERTIITEEEIRAKVAELGAKVSADYAAGLLEDGDELLLVGVFKGAVMFMADFARALSVPVKMEFMALSSYGSSTTSSGTVRILKDIDSDVEGKHILVVEDIIDSGLTLSWLLKYLEGLRPASVSVVSMLRKPGVQRVDIPVKYLGFDIPNEFVVGYGLDYAERYRELPFIGVLKPEVYQ
ncbi:hypoxanthine phosphoribosyltransferase [Glycomyces terrestris]|uniref:Hypoxanthine phosphoribosyltransferase n=1 Tax=Glycomyces terrestris TaxID=2493553 RepID=A0A426USF8_9ACTN|nr:hypoxanthine phosphoribosyltransferase [Glycomyces terrestris]RRR96489.1 hypoxanthine phosphoribosyltransferase [Glycomyces terrestris]